MRTLGHGPGYVVDAGTTLEHFMAIWLGRWTLTLDTSLGVPMDPKLKRFGQKLPPSSLPRPAAKTTRLGAKRRRMPDGDRWM